MTNERVGIHIRLPIRPLISREQWGLKNTPIVDFIIESEAYQSADTYRQQCKVLSQLGQSQGLTNHYLAKLMGVDHKTFMKQVNLALSNGGNFFKKVYLSFAIYRPSIINGLDIFNIDSCFCSISDSDHSSIWSNTI